MARSQHAFATDAAAMPSRWCAPWHLILLWFAGSVSVWILTGFFQRDFSLTVLLFPPILLLFGGTWLAALASHRGIVLPSAEQPFAWMAASIGLVTVVQWSISGILLALPVKARIFNLALPLGVAALHLAIWTTPITRRTIRRLLVAFAGVTVVNDILSVLTFLAFNVLQLLPTEIFYFNPRYPVILFHAAGRGLVRTPGLFETGGSNGTFMLLAAVPLLSFLLFSGARGSKRTMGWVAFAVQAVLIAATLTRRSVLALALATGLLLVWHAVTTRQFRYVAVLATLGAAGAIAIVARAPELATIDTVVTRLGHWQENISGLFSSRPAHIAFGFGVLQASLEMIPGSTFRILDNTALELLVYGGFPLLVVVSVYYGLIAAVNARLAVTLRGPDRWVPIANVALVGAVASIGMFTPFFYSVTESIPACLAVNLATKYGLGCRAGSPLQSASADAGGAA